MSILSGFISTIKYRKTKDGYKKQSEWTSAQDVELSNGKNLQDSWDENIKLVYDTSDDLEELREDFNMKVTYAQDGDISKTEPVELTSVIKNVSFTKGFAEIPSGFSYGVLSVIAQFTNTQVVKIVSSRVKEDGATIVLYCSPTNKGNGDEDYSGSLDVHLLIFSQPE